MQSMSIKQHDPANYTHRTPAGLSTCIQHIDMQATSYLQNLLKRLEFGNFSGAGRIKLFSSKRCHQNDNQPT
jgi:hypothetical protein